ncbi:MAG: response regulator [Deltaproteobacteria bacterium]|nr:response regulator [Deltaproteobacteria bacterium]
MENGKKKVLIIDDEGDLVRLLVLRLQKFGFLVDVALDGEQGLEQTKSFKPDLILLDVALPRMGGWEVCQKLKTDAATKKIPIIVITAKPIKNLETKARDFGVNRILTKPFDSVELVQTIKSLT